LVPKGASILGFSPNHECKTIYTNIYSQRYESDSHADRQSEPSTHLFDLTLDRHFGKGQLRAGLRRCG
jgi:hypothetical protein